MKFFLIFFLSCYLNLCALDGVKVFSKKINGNFIFYANNKLSIPVTVILQDLKLNNLKLQPNKLSHQLKAHKKEQSLYKMLPINKDRGFGYNLSYDIVPGHSKKANLSQPYLLPFEHGKKYPISQGYNGAFSHQGSSRYALDFDMPVGTPICASADGIVFEIKSDGTRGGTSRTMKNEGNYISIYHPQNNTYSSYAHLQYRGVLVQVGGKVKAGQIIGKSGATGYGTGPHLHFSVRQGGQSSEKNSLPTSFLTSLGVQSYLKEGYFYYSVHPNKKPFKPVFGRDIKEADVTKTSPTSYTDKVRIHKEKIDDTYIYYIKNGKKKEVQVNFIITQERGIWKSKSTPITQKIAPLTKSFLLIVRPQLKKGVDYTFRYKITYIVKK